MSWQDLVQRVTPDMSEEALLRMVSTKYNRCAIKCLSFKRVADAEDPTAMIEEVYALLSEIESVLPALSDSPLPGNLMRKRKYGFVYEFRSKLNKLRDQYADDRAMKALSAAKKQELLGFYPVNFRKSAKIARTRQADQGKTKRSVRLLMEAYAEPIEDDPNAALEDPIALCTQAEIFRDAAQHEELLGIFDAESIAGILKLLPKIGRLAKRLMVPEPLNCYAQQLELDTVIRFTSTHTLWSKNGSVKGSDTLILQAVHPAGNNFFTHAQSFLLLNNPDCDHADSRIAACYLWLEALLRQGPTLPSWAVEELGMVQALADTQTQPWWRAYLQAASGPDFHECLVTEFPKEDGKPPHLRCPHPGKFILAVWLGIRHGEAYTQEELDARFRLVVVEIMGRSRFWTPERVFDGQPVSAAADAILEDAWGRCMVDFLRSNPYAPLPKVQSRFREFLSDRKNLQFGHPVLDVSKVLEIQYYRLSVSRAIDIFAHLAGACGLAPPALDELDILNAIEITLLCPRSTDRCRRASVWEPEKAHNLPKTLTEVLFRREYEAVFARSLEFARVKVDQMMAGAHALQPFTFPAEHVRQYRLDTGRDPAADFCVDHTGLSRNACCSPSCPFFLVPGDVHLLREHLHPDALPGYHQCIAQFRCLTVQEIVGRIARGALIKTPLLDRKARQRLRRVPADKRAAEEARLLEAARSHTLARIAALASQPGFEDSVRETLGAYANPPPYAEFRAALDAAYCRLRLEGLRY